MHLKTAHNKSHGRRGFTLVEVIVAGVIAAFVIGSISATVGQLARTKASSRQRLAAYLRADAALNSIRSDIISIIRDGDLFYTKLLITDDVVNTAAGPMDRDEVLVFNTKLRAVRDLTYQGEGLEYETQYRIQDDQMGPVLWQRRDAVIDEYTLGGGQAFPLVEGVIGVAVQAYDGTEWREQWDSDEDGLPLAVRITVTASGQSGENDLATAPLATLRTVVPIDRVAPPLDQVLPTPEDEQDLEEYLDALLANFGAGATNNNPNAPGGQNGGAGSMGQAGEEQVFEGGVGTVTSVDMSPAERARLRGGAAGQTGGGGVGGTGGGTGGGDGGSPPPGQPAGIHNTGGSRPGGGSGNVGGGGRSGGGRQ